MTIKKDGVNGHGGKKTEQEGMTGDKVQYTLWLFSST